MTYMPELTPPWPEEPPVHIHGSFCGCEPCRDERYDTWTVEAAQGLRCPTCFSAAADKGVHLRWCSHRL